MSAAQHTPGPWKTQRVHSGRIIYTETQRDFETKETRTLAFLVRNEAQFPVEQSDANGRLIAAAPDLLAALYASEIALRSVLRQNVQVDAAFEHVGAAIAKAQGARATGAEGEGAK